MSATYISAALRRRVRERAKHCCEYCLIGEEDSFFPHEPDHVIAEKHGGETTFANLALACLDCNRFKGTDIASRDPKTKRLVPLFDPRSDSWPDHFEIRDGTIVPLTPIARATERLMKFNLPERVEVRATLARVGLYPRVADVT